jgi:ABC-2 type transport system permease protein
LGATTIAAYPLSFVIVQVTALVPVIVYLFVGHMVTTNTDAVGGTWFSFVVVGVVVTRVLGAAVSGLADEVEDATQQGRLEILLTTPVNARLLPFFLVEWPLISRVITGVILVAAGVALGAHLQLAGLAIALLLVALGLLAAVGIGFTAVAMQMLVKRSGAVHQLHAFAVATLAGTYFPTSLLPGPLRGASWLLPETWVLIGVRHAVLVDPAHLDGPATPVVIAVLAAFAAFLCPFGLWLYGRALRVARRTGLLVGY